MGHEQFPEGCRNRTLYMAWQFTVGGIHIGFRSYRRHMTFGHSELRPILSGRVRPINLTT